MLPTQKGDYLWRSMQREYHRLSPERPALIQAANTDWPKAYPTRTPRVIFMDGNSA